MEVVEAEAVSEAIVLGVDADVVVAGVDFKIGDVGEGPAVTVADEEGDEEVVEVDDDASDIGVFSRAAGDSAFFMFFFKTGKIHLKLFKITIMTLDST